MHLFILDYKGLVRFPCMVSVPTWYMRKFLEVFHASMWIKIIVTIFKVGKIYYPTHAPIFSHTHVPGKHLEGVFFYGACNEYS